MLILLMPLLISLSFANPVDCYKEAIQLKDRSNITLTTSNAVALCKGATSLLPVTCYKRALEEKDEFGVLLILNPLNLCAGARGFSPVDCYKQALETKDFYNVKLSTSTAMAMCSQGNDTH